MRFRRPSISARRAGAWFPSGKPPTPNLPPQVPPPLPDAVVASTHALSKAQEQLSRNDQTARSSGESNDTDRPASADARQPTKDSGESHVTAIQHDVQQQQPQHGATPSKPDDNTKKPGERPKLPRPDVQLSCPRCNSADTKFCYYNNYNINQPRYYCKACQRYWTAGGTLRNVPPGSGKRKNKSTRKASTEAPPAHMQPPVIPQQQLLAAPYANLVLGDQLYAGFKPTDAAALAAAVPFMPTPGVQLAVPPLPTMQSAFAQAPPIASLKPADGSGPLPVLPPGFASVTLPPLPTATSLPLHSTASMPILPTAPPAEAAMDRSTTALDDGSSAGRRVRLRTDPALASAPPSGELTSDTGASTRDAAPEWLANYHQQAALIYGAQNAAYGFGWPYGLYANPAAAQSWAVQQYAARYVVSLMPGLYFHTLRATVRCAQTWPDAQQAPVPPPHSVEAGPPVQAPQATKLAPPPLPTAASAPLPPTSAPPVPASAPLPLLQAMEQMGPQQ